MKATETYENPDGVMQTAAIDPMPGRVITCLNVNDALPQGLAYLKAKGQPAAPRGFKVLEAHGPVITHYQNPSQCVLYDDVRMCNHFFHFQEAMWILAGRRDVEFLRAYNKAIAKYSDSGESFYGAYGYRLRGELHDKQWRNQDQLHWVVQRLKEDPDSRQGVATIWHRDDCSSKTLDLPCNNLLYFSLRKGRLHMTIICRSNDIVWGAYGANAVQFSFIQRWVAAALGVKAGELFQISNNYHVYTEREDFERLCNHDWIYRRPHAPYVSDIFETAGPQNVEVFDEELVRYCSDLTMFNRNRDSMTLPQFYEHGSGIDPTTFEEPVLELGVALHNLWTAHKLWIKEGRPKDLRPVDHMFEGEYGSYDFQDNVINGKLDWIAGARQWLTVKENLDA